MHHISFKWIIRKLLYFLWMMCETMQIFWPWHCSISYSSLFLLCVGYAYCIYTHLLKDILNYCLLMTAQRFSYILSVKDWCYWAWACTCLTLPSHRKTFLPCTSCILAWRCVMYLAERLASASVPRSGNPCYQLFT